MTNGTRAPHIAAALLIAAGASFVPSVASAQALFFHVDGEPGNRQAYYSQTLVMDRTPADQLMGQIEVKQLDVTVIHENAAKPEWTMMRVQFECPSMLSLAASPTFASVSAPAGTAGSVLAPEKHAANCCRHLANERPCPIAV